MTTYTIGKNVYDIDFEADTRTKVIRFHIYRKRAQLPDHDFPWHKFPDMLGNIGEGGCSNWEVRSLTFEGRAELADLLLLPNKCMDIYNEVMIIEPLTNIPPT